MRNWLRSIWWDHGEWIIAGGIVLAILGFITLLILVATWQEQFKALHHCAPTGRQHSVLVMLPAQSGKTTIIVPTFVVEQEWKCDDGAHWF